MRISKEFGDICCNSLSNYSYLWFRFDKPKSIENYKNKQKKKGINLWGDDSDEYDDDDNEEDDQHFSEINQNIQQSPVQTYPPFLCYESKCILFLGFFLRKFAILIYFF